MLLLLVPWRAAELAVLTDVPVVGEEAVGAEALLWHFLASFVMEWQYPHLAQDTKGVVEASTVLSSNSKSASVFFRHVVDKCNLTYWCPLVAHNPCADVNLSSSVSPSAPLAS